MTEAKGRGAGLAAAVVLAILAAHPAAAQPRQLPRAGTALPAPAATVEALFTEFGLFGAWAIDCDAPASPSNPHVSVTPVATGLVMETHELGPGSLRNRYSVLSAERLSKDRIAIRVIFQPGTEFEERQRLELVVRDGSRRTMFNQPDGQPPRVKDGVALGFGLKTPLLRKCG